MQLHFINGFLGSGKTTAIIGACKQLMNEGKRVGVITNDQGRHLVDTAFFRMSAVPALEVTGGCFCVHYDDLEERLEEIKNDQNLDVLFAEAVGTSADLVAAVVQPLMKRRSQLPTYSVFCDSRLLNMHLLGIKLPFSEDVLYIFEKQIEGAGLLVINKIDLLSPQEGQSFEALVHQRYPEKRLRFQNSLNAGGISLWLSDLHQGKAQIPEEVLELDYFSFGKGEAKLAWLDEEIVFSINDGQGSKVVEAFFKELLQKLAAAGIIIGHLKMALSAGEIERKFSFTVMSDAGWQETIPELPAGEIRILLNARLEVRAAMVRQIIKDTLEACSAGYHFQYETSRPSAFHPELPDERQR